MIKQIKSHWYYYFWGSATVAVIAGQIYVGLGYREMAEATKSTDIRVSCDIPVIPYVEFGGNRTTNFE